jgi:molybdopterin molybdotransferase
VASESPSELISIERARARVLEAVRPLDHETVEIAAALGRVLARNVRAEGDVPPFPCSAMDGYAIRSGPAGRTLQVVAESRAGAPADRRLAEGEAIRASTGAAIPPGADAVVRQEDVEERGEQVAVNVAVAPGDNVRAAGEDLRKGAPVLAAGTVLGPSELGFAVGAGAAELTVARLPTVAILCTGDELRAPGEPLGPGQIHNSNATMLEALVQRTGARAHAAERVPDSLASTEAALARALDRADVVVVSGGVSVGPHDHVKPALEALGVRELFWGVALQPGKPTWVGERAGKLVFGLPGNPVSSVVTFTLFAVPAIAALQGATAPEPTREQAMLGVAVKRNPAREQAVRVRLEQRDGARVAIPNGPQASHLVRSLVGADALALIPAGNGELQAGTAVALERLPR